MSARICLFAGTLTLSAAVLNQVTANSVEPALQRSSALAALLSVGLLLIGALWTRVIPVAPERAALHGVEGLLLRQDLPDALISELKWGSQLLLRATPAVVVLIWWRGEVLMQRGLIGAEPASSGFQPGSICQQTLQKGRAIHLVDLRHYPGRDEFKALLDGLPSVVVQPIAQEGLLLLGGWSPRCFSSADQTWIAGWADRLTDEWLGPSGALQNAGPAAVGATAPVNQDC